MSNKKKWILGVLGSLIVGALGSGLWNEVFAPVGSAGLRALMSLLTLGISSARDAIYVRAAHGFTERPSVLLLTFVGLGFFYLPLTVLFLRHFVPWLSQRVRQESSTSRATVAQLRRRNFYMVLIMCFGGAVIFVQTLFVAYTDTVVARFNQSLAVAGPYITQEQRTTYLARFGSMRTRQDFVEMFGELNALAVSHGQRASDFSPW